MNREQRLDRAEEHIFSTGLDDGAAKLGLRNMRYGLAKIHYVQELLGCRADATFVAAPDVTVTRNTNRWLSGIGYGGRLTWGEGTHDLVVLDVKPNHCGVLVGGLDALPEAPELIDRLAGLESTEESIDSIPIRWDLGNSNHFITVFRVRPRRAARLPPFAFIMHSSGGELRGETSEGDGLYWDKGQSLADKAELIETPFGPLRILTGQDARAYIDFNRRAHRFSQKRRGLAADRLFGDYSLISNDSHQAMVNMNDMLLGCYEATAGRLFPITLRAELPAFLLEARPNLTEDSIDNLNFAGRAKRLGIYHRLTKTNVLAHGGGYALPQVKDVHSVLELEHGRLFEIGLADGSRQFIRETRGLPYSYRGEEVVRRSVQLGLGELAARLDPVFSLKP